MSTTARCDHTTKHEGQVDIDPMTVIKESLVTVGIGRDGKMYLIGPDGTVFDPKNMPPACDKIGKGTVETFQSLSVFATTGSPTEVRFVGPEGPVCFVVDFQIGKVLGNCPKEHFM